MPGIAGIFGGGNPDALTAQLSLMSGAMLHDPGYSSGQLAEPSLGLYVAWTAHRGSFADCMPVSNAARDVFIVFAGEDFAGRGDSMPSSVGRRDRDPGTAAYLIDLYEEKGQRFIDGLNGWFSGLVVDLRTGTGILFNDRFGLHRLYVHESADALYFASEAKAILRARPALRCIDPAALGELVSTGCVLQGKTLFPGISVLPGGSRWTLAPRTAIRKDAYFDHRTWEDQAPLGEDAFSSRLQQTFHALLPRYLRGGGGLAMSLTGGLDGRMIMACAQAAPGTLPCYTFAGPYRENADLRIAREVARACGQRHTTLSIGELFFEQFPALAEASVYVSDGTMDVSGSVELYANRLARGIAPIRLTGNYGSEILRGVVAFRPQRFREPAWFSADFARLVRAAEATYANARRGNDTSFIAFRQVPWFHFGRFSLESSLLTPRSPFLDNDLVSLVFQAPPPSLRSPAASLALIASGNARLARIPTDRGLRLGGPTALDRWRCRYLALTFKAEYAYDYGMPPWLAAIDRALAPARLERLFLGRHKFYHFRVWYRDRLARYLKEMLLDERSLARPYLDGDHVRRIVAEHTRGVRNYTSELHQVLTVELIHRTLIER
ncbi:MAG: asparagine synthase-related protein [Burkholderiales bacterium]